MKTVRTLAKGQVVIPADVRHDLGIRPGTRLSLSVAGNGIILMPLRKNPWREAHGLFAGKGTPAADLEREHQEELRRERRRYRR